MPKMIPKIILLKWSSKMIPIMISEMDIENDFQNLIKYAL